MTRPPAPQFRIKGYVVIFQYWKPAHSRPGWWYCIISDAGRTYHQQLDIASFFPPGSPILQSVRDRWNGYMLRCIDAVRKQEAEQGSV